MVTRRTREIGIQVLATVAGRTTALLGGGTVAGTVLGVTMAGFQSVILIRMPEIGWATPAMVIAALVSASAVAAWLPTRRALAIRPSGALNTE